MYSWWGENTLGRERIRNPEPSWLVGDGKFPVSRAPQRRERRRQGCKALGRSVCGYSWREPVPGANRDTRACHLPHHSPGCIGSPGSGISCAPDPETRTRLPSVSLPRPVAELVWLSEGHAVSSFESCHVPSTSLAIYSFLFNPHNMLFNNYHHVCLTNEKKNETQRNYRDLPN